MLERSFVSIGDMHLLFQDKSKYLHMYILESGSCTTGMFT